MSRHLATAALVLLSLGVCGCGLPVIATEYAVHKVHTAVRAMEPDSESKWNKYGWWQRVADDPATYIPKDYPAGASRTGSAGVWFSDERDGKRLDQLFPIGGLPGRELTGSGPIGRTRG